MAISEQSSIASHSILLINPPSPTGMTANREGAGGLGALSAGEHGFLYPPQTLAYAAAVLRAHGWAVHILDAAGERLVMDDALARIAAQSAPIIAVQAAHISLDSDIAFLNRLRTSAPQARLIAVGASMPWAGPLIIERTDVDHILAGEPEGMLLPVCQAIAGNNLSRLLPRTISSLAVAGSPNTDEGRLTDLDSLPFPAWDLVPWQRYGFLTMLASRGCDDTCAFCPYVLGQGRRFRPRAAALVVKEMQWLASAFHPPRVIVRDPVFAHDQSRVEQICQGMIASGTKLAWECESRPEHFDSSLLRLLRRAGCTSVKLGFETTSASVLRDLRRIGDADAASPYMAKTANVAAACGSVGISCRLFVMTGLPGQTNEDIAETIAFLQGVPAGEVHVKPFYRYPGLPMPAADLNEERRRGENQAAMVQDAIHQWRRRQAVHPLTTLRRWLRRRRQR